MGASAREPRQQAEEAGSWDGRDAVDFPHGCGEFEQIAVWRRVAVVMRKCTLKRHYTPVGWRILGGHEWGIWVAAGAALLGGADGAIACTRQNLRTPCRTLLGLHSSADTYSRAESPGSAEERRPSRCRRSSQNTTSVRYDSSDVPTVEWRAAEAASRVSPSLRPV